VRREKSGTPVKMSRIYPIETYKHWGKSRQAILAERESSRTKIHRFTQIRCFYDLAYPKFNQEVLFCISNSNESKTHSTRRPRLGQDCQILLEDYTRCTYWIIMIFFIDSQKEVRKPKCF